MNKIFIAFFLLTFSSCMRFEEKYKPPEYMNYLNKIRQSTIQELKNKDLHVAGVGGGAIDCIRMVYLGFNYNKSADISKARDLIVLAAETLLKKINSHEKIRPDLCNYPFNIDNIEIDILFVKNKKKSTSEDLKNIVTFVTLKKGVIKYKNSRSNSYVIETISQESFEEAKEKVENGSKIINE